MAKVTSEVRAGTPESEEGSMGVVSAGELVEVYSGSKDTKHAAFQSTAPALAFEELSEETTRREKVNVPGHLEDVVCSHCGSLRSSRQYNDWSGALDPTEGKWYCYICWRQFRRDVYELSLPNNDAGKCDSCGIYLHEKQGRVMDAENDDVKEPQLLYCVHCWTT